MRMPSGSRCVGVAVPVRVGDAPLVPRPGRAGQAGRLDQGLVTTLVPHVDHGGPAGAGTCSRPSAEHPDSDTRRHALAASLSSRRPAAAAVPATAARLVDGWLRRRLSRSSGPGHRRMPRTGAAPRGWPTGAPAPRPVAAISCQITATPVAIRPRTTTAVARRRGNGSCSGPAPSHGGVVRENIRQLTAPRSRSRLRSSSRPGQAPGSYPGGLLQAAADHPGSRTAR